MRQSNIVETQTKSSGANDNFLPPDDFFREQEEAWLAQCEAKNVIPFDRTTKANAKASQGSASDKVKPIISICMADVEREELKWMWFPYIPLGKCTVIDGDPGQGKSFLCTEIAARLSQGEKLPGMSKKPEPVKR
jgi:hypothetical protein